MHKTLTLTSFVAAALMLIAAANLVLVYVLLNAHPHVGPPSTDLASNLPIAAVGGIPFLATAALITWTALRARTNIRLVERLIVIGVLGLPVLAACGLWSGLVSSMNVPLDGSPPADALYVYQFTFIAAVAGDLVVLVMAIVTFTRRSGRAASPDK